VVESEAGEDRAAFAVGEEILQDLVHGIPPGGKFGFIGERKNETVGTGVLDGPQISLTRQRFLVERWRTVEDAGPYIRGEPHR
jgi:hypothetical protein